MAEMKIDITDVIEKAIEKIEAEGCTVQKWIPCSERLPEKAGEYLVTYHPCFWDDVEWSKRCVGIDTFRGKSTWAKKKYQRVTHWMPLPEPPESDVQDCVRVVRF